MAKLDLFARLHRQIGDQKIDLVIQPDLSRPFVRIAVKERNPALTIERCSPAGAVFSRDHHGATANEGVRL